MNSVAVLPVASASAIVIVYALVPSKVLRLSTVVSASIVAVTVPSVVSLRSLAVETLIVPVTVKFWSVILICSASSSASKVMKFASDPVIVSTAVIVNTVSVPPVTVFASSIASVSSVAVKLVSATTTVARFPNDPSSNLVSSAAAVSNVVISSISSEANPVTAEASIATVVALLIVLNSVAVLPVASALSIVIVYALLPSKVLRSSTLVPASIVAVTVPDVVPFRRLALVTLISPSLTVKSWSVEKKLQQK